MQKEIDTEQKRLSSIIAESKKRVWQYIAFLSAYLVTTLKALVWQNDLTVFFCLESYYYF